jgi:hypothetical protein
VVDPVLLLLRSPTAPAMAIDERVILARCRIAARRHSCSRVAVGYSVTACVVALVVSAWPALRSPENGGNGWGSTSRGAVANVPNTSPWQPTPCGASSRRWADTGNVAVGDRTHRRIIVDTNTCAGVMVSAGSTGTGGSSWVSANAPVGRSGRPSRAFLLISSEPDPDLRETTPNLVAYAMLPPGYRACGWSTSGQRSSGAHSPTTVLRITDGWTALITDLDDTTDASRVRLRICEAATGAEDPDTRGYAVTPSPANQPGIESGG